MASEVRVRCADMKESSLRKARRLTRPQRVLHGWVSTYRAMTLSYTSDFIVSSAIDSCRCALAPSSRYAPQARMRGAASFVPRLRRWCLLLMHPTTAFAAARCSDVTQLNVCVGQCQVQNCGAACGPAASGSQSDAWLPETMYLSDVIYADDRDACVFKHRIQVICTSRIFLNTIFRAGPYMRSCGRSSSKQKLMHSLCGTRWPAPPRCRSPRWSSGRRRAARPCSGGGCRKQPWWPAVAGACRGAWQPTQCAARPA